MAGDLVSYSPQFITGEPQFRTPSPSERDKIRTSLFLALILFMLAGIILLVWGAIDLSNFAKLKAMSIEELRDYFGQAFGSASQEDLDTKVLTYALYGSIKISFGIAGFLMMLLVRMKAIIPLEKGEYEDAGRYMNMFMVMGFIFGLVLAGIFIYKAKKVLKSTAVRISPQQTMNGSLYLGTGGVSQDIRRCPTCNSMMRFNDQTKLWFCPSCNKYQM